MLPNTFPSKSIQPHKNINTLLKVFVYINGDKRYYENSAWLKYVSKTMPPSL